MVFSKANLQLLIWCPVFIPYLLELVFNIQVIPFILTLAVPLTLSNLLDFWTNFLLMGFKRLHKMFRSYLSYRQSPVSILDTFSYILKFCNKWVTFVGIKL